MQLSQFDPLAAGLAFGFLASGNNSFLCAPPAGYDVSTVLISDNFAVIPGEWESGSIKSAFYEIQSSDAAFTNALNHIREADFIAWEASFFTFIGPQARIERILAFPGLNHVHEAPVYVPETNELLFSDTAATGWLWAINADTYQTRNLTTDPPLWNVNGGTYHNGKTYFLTNGNTVRGIYSVNYTDGSTMPIVNNYRSRHLNSPNDIIADSKSNFWFTDPVYGWYNSWQGVQAPELPNTIYFFNSSTNALIAASTNVLMPNGLALSNDESILYVSDSNSTSGRPLTSVESSTRSIWAFDVRGSQLHNQRLIYTTETGWPDGIRITASGYLMIGAYAGVDIVDPITGVLVGKINTPDDVIFNLEGIPGTGTWFLTGRDYIYKVSMGGDALCR